MEEKKLLNINEINKKDLSNINGGIGIGSGIAIWAAGEIISCGVGVYNGYKDTAQAAA